PRQPRGLRHAALAARAGAQAGRVLAGEPEAPGDAAALRVARRRRRAAAEDQSAAAWRPRPLARRPLVEARARGERRARHLAPARRPEPQALEPDPRQRRRMARGLEAD